jgi:hypothetical protein
MKSFKDSTGETWEIRLTFGLIDDINENLKADLLQPEAGEPMLLGRLVTDDSLLLKIVWACMEKQAVERGLDKRDALDRFDGGVISKAAEAFFAEWQDFFQSRRQPQRAAMIAKMLEALTAGQDKVTEAIQAMDTVKQISEELSGKLPASSE